MPRYPALGQTLQDLPDLSELMGRVRQLQDLDARLRAHLEPGLAAGCQLANLREDTLVFLARSPAFATKLRMSSRRLLREAERLLERRDLRLTVKVQRP